MNSQENITADISRIQQLAAQLDSTLDNHSLINLACNISRAITKLSFKIEDAPAQLATYIFEQVGRDMVRLPVLAGVMFPDSHQKNFARSLRTAIRAGKIPATKKHGCYYASRETIAGYFRLPSADRN